MQRFFILPLKIFCNLEVSQINDFMSKNSSFPALERQRQIYVAGMSGKQPLVPFDIQQLEKKAKEKMTPEAFAYVAGGAAV